MATAQHPAAPSHAVACSRSAPARAPLLLLAQAPLAPRHRPHRRLPRRAHRLQLRSAQRPPRLRQASQVPQFPAARPRARVGLHLHPPRLSRPLRRLHRHPRPLQRHLLPLGRQLDVCLPAHHRPHRLPLHRPARLPAALHRRLAPRASRRSLRQGPARTRQPVDARHLRHRHDRHHLALRLRHLALRRQVGHHPRRQSPQKFGWVCGLGGAALCLMGHSIYASSPHHPPLDVMPAPDHICRKPHSLAGRWLPWHLAAFSCSPRGIHRTTARVRNEDRRNRLHARSA